MYNIGIVGIGFLGGSLVKSLSKSKKVKSIVACDKNINSLNTMDQKALKGASKL